MLNSKALKDFSKEKRSKLYGWWVDTAVADFYYRWSWKLFGNRWFQIKRLIQWYLNVFRFDFDFDGHSLFAIIEYKLKRIEKALINGCSIQEPQDMKALKLAIKLVGRLKEGEYEERGYNRINKKYGELKTWFEPCEDKPGYSTWHSSRSKVKTEEQKKEEWEYRLAQYAASDYRMKREERWLYAILHKYLRVWWD